MNDIVSPTAVGQSLAAVGQSLVALPLKGEIFVPGDKSLVHRALMFSAIASGTSFVRTTACGRDNLATLRAIQSLGVNTSSRLTKEVYRIAAEEGLSDIACQEGSKMCEISVTGSGLHGLKNPQSAINCGNSGTTARLLTGLLAGAGVEATLDGDSSLRRRPMKRVTQPLSLMGAEFTGDVCPFTIKHGVSKGIHYRSPQPSAQVKSAILIAGLAVSETVAVEESILSRDHTEKMFTLMGCPVTREVTHDGWVRVALPPEVEKRRLKAAVLDVPGDFSSAAFILGAASIIPGSDVMLRGVGFNPTRIGFYHLLQRMGASLQVFPVSSLSGEEVVDIRVQSAALRAIEVQEADVVYAIDEIPILAVTALFSDGATTIRGARELRVKESDRLSMMASLLQLAGAEVEELEDGLRIHGRPDLLDSEPGVSRLSNEGLRSGLSKLLYGCGDHRIVMCASILSYALSGCFSIEDEGETETSFPGFKRVFSELISA